MLGKFFLRKDRNVSRKTYQDADEFSYCPSCGGEFRIEFKRCASCDVELVSAATRHGNAVETIKLPGVDLSADIGPEEENLIAVKQGTLMELKQIRHLLSKHDLASLLTGDGAASNKGCCASASFILVVREEALSLATEVLSADFRRSTALDSHRVTAKAEVVFDEDAGKISCPACGGSFVPQELVCPECGLCF